MILFAPYLRLVLVKQVLIQQRCECLKNSYHQAGADLGFMEPEVYTIREGPC